MTFDPLSWAVGFGLNAAVKRLLRRFTPDLQRKLQKAVEKWASDLPANIRVRPEALFPTISPNSDDLLPGLQRVREKFSQNLIPTADDWADAISEHRRELRKHHASGELQPFFEASEDDVSGAIESLADEFHRLCIIDDTLYRTTSLASLDSIQDAIIRNRGVEELLVKLEAQLNEFRWRESESLLGELESELRHQRIDAQLSRRGWILLARFEESRLHRARAAGQPIDLGRLKELVQEAELATH